MTRARRATAAAGAVLTLVAMAGCGQGGEVSLPTALPGASITAAPSVSLPALPSPTRTLPTRSPGTTQAPTDEPAPTETATSAPQETPTTPEPTDTESTAVALPPVADPTTTAEQTPTTPAPTSASPTPTSESPTPTSASPTPSETTAETTAPTETESASPTASETASPTEPESPSPSSSAEADEPTSAGPALWLGLLALLALAVALITLLVVRSRRGKWDSRLQEEQGQATWLLAGLLPVVTDPATDPALRSAHWSGAQATLDQLETGLAGLLADAPDQARGERVGGLAQAVSGVRAAVAADLALRTGAVASAPVDEAALLASAAGVQAARDRLAAALATPAG